MDQWIRMGERLRARLNPATFPVAVKFLDDEARIPEKARRPLRDLKVRMAPCQGASMTRRYGWTVAFSREDAGCAIADHTYGWKRLGDPSGAIDFLTRMNYASDETAAAEVIGGFRLLERSEDVIVVYSPLEQTKIEPDVILIYVNPAQLMRLIHGATYASGQPIQSTFSGRAASCTEGVIAAYLDRDIKVVVPGNGDRVWAGCQDHEMVAAIHADRLAEIVEGIEKTHETGIRYPIPTYLRYAPEVRLSIPLSDIFGPEKIG